MASSADWGNGPSSGVDNGWNNDGVPNGGGFGNGHEEETEGGGRVNDGLCFNCGEPGHNKADCPNPKTFSGPCRYCKKEGHMRADCPEAPKGCARCGAEDHMVRDCPQPLICLNCKQEGHYAKECPTRVCKNCNQPGHTRSECNAARQVDRSHLPDMTVEAAWARITNAAADKDLDDLKEAVQIYTKASPETTYAQLEEAFRNQGLEIYLIALEKFGMATTLTNMDLQGGLGKKYTVNYRFSPKPGRPREITGWPNPAENMERLADAGEVVELGLPKCSNCDELGHISKSCPQEKQEATSRTVISCYNCGEEGHRIRDCPQPRIDKFACKNCGQGGHTAKECTEPRNPATVKCNKCEEMGHFAKDCPKETRSCNNCGETGHISRDCTAPPKCRNCDEVGHVGKDCPKPRDWSRAKCSNCGEMGHTKVRCKQPVPAEEENGGHDGGGSNGFDISNGDGFDNGGGHDNVASGGNDWANGSSANAPAVGGDDW